MWVVLTIHEGGNFKAETENAHEMPSAIIISQEKCTPVFLLKTQNYETLFGGSNTSQREFVAAI